ncbi:unnamed protein product, partial [Laminaria digitata]
MNGTRRQRSRAEGRNFSSVALARLACLCCALQTGTGFVGHLPRGPSIAAGAPAAAAPAGQHHQRSWSSTLRTSHQREQLGQSIGSSAGESRTSNAFARSRSSVDGRSSRVASAAPVEMVGAAAAAASIARRGSTTTTTALGMAAAAGTSAAGPGLASDAPAKKLKKRGRPRKVPLVVSDVETVPKATSDAQRDIAEAASAGRAAAAAAASQDDNDAATAVRTRTTTTTAATMTVEREDVEATIREEGAPTVVTTKGFAPLEDDQDVEEEEE